MSRRLSARVSSWSGKPCPYCARLMGGKRVNGNSLHPTTDHVFPLSLGGTNTVANRVIVCRRCNGDKGNMPIAFWQAKLVRDCDPRADHVLEFMSLRGELAYSFRSPLETTTTAILYPCNCGASFSDKDARNICRAAHIAPPYQGRLLNPMMFSEDR